MRFDITTPFQEKFGVSPHRSVRLATAPMSVCQPTTSSCRYRVTRIIHGRYQGHPMVSHSAQTLARCGLLDINYEVPYNGNLPNVCSSLSDIKDARLLAVGWAEPQNLSPCFCRPGKSYSQPLQYHPPKIIMKSMSHICERLAGYIGSILTHSCSITLSFIYIIGFAPLGRCMMKSPIILLCWEPGDYQ